MDARKTLLAWMIGLSSVFGFATAYSQQPVRQPSDGATVTALGGEEKRLDLNSGAKEELRSTAKKMVFKLSAHLQFGMAKQVMEMEGILHARLPGTVRNRIIMALNDDKRRAKAVSALEGVVNGVLSVDGKQAEKCRACINGWQKDPLSFAKFLGDAVGEDFIGKPGAAATSRPAF